MHAYDVSVDAAVYLAVYAIVFVVCMSWHLASFEHVL